jgi:hypothetical protein
MKYLILATAAAAVAVPTVIATPAEAQYRSREYQRELRECNRELRRADSRREYRQELRECRRELNRAQRYRTWGRYDYNRYEPGYRAYYADRYYRSGSYYRDHRLTRRDRIYYGNDGRYYCRRSDGTTGLIVGAAIGALIGNQLDRGGSRVAGTLIGGATGAALGSAIDRGQVRCD